MDGNYTRILSTVLKKSWKQHPSKEQLYGSQTSKQDEQDIQDTAEEARKNLLVSFFYGPLPKNNPVLADQQELIYNSSVWTRDVVVWKIYQVK